MSQKNDTDASDNKQLMKRWQLKGAICSGKSFKLERASGFNIHFMAFGTRHARSVGVKKLRAYIERTVGSGEFALGVVSLKMGRTIFLLQGSLRNNTFTRIKKTGKSFERVNQPVSKSHAGQLRHS